MHTYNQKINSFFGGELDIIEINREKKCKRLTIENFIKRAKKIHGDKFDYFKCRYINMSTKIIIVCKKHNNEFIQTPINHLYSPIGCPICNKNVKPKTIHKISVEKINESKIKVCSSGEKLIEFWLNKNSIKYEKQKTFSGCKNRRKLRYDFYLPNENILIEYDGRQHFKSIECFGGENEFIVTQMNDKIKTDYAMENNITLLRIPYTERKNLSNILKNKIKN